MTEINPTTKDKDYLSEQLTLDLFSDIASLYLQVKGAVRESLEDYEAGEIDELIAYFSSREYSVYLKLKDQS